MLQQNDCSQLTLKLNIEALNFVYFSGSSGRRTKFFIFKVCIFFISLMFVVIF